jgi:hypothetical protein
LAALSTHLLKCFRRKKACTAFQLVMEHPLPLVQRPLVRHEGGFDAAEVNLNE